MKNCYLLLILLFFSVTPLALPDDKDGKKQVPNLRQATTITLAVEGGKTRKVEIPAGKFLDAKGVLTLYPGDKVHLEFQKQGDRLVNPRVVRKITAPKRTITFKMTQDASVTMLMRNTGIQQTVALDCGHLGLGRDQYYRTNLYPTEKGLSSFDSWPNNVWSIKLAHIEVTAESAGKVYKMKVSK